MRFETDEEGQLWLCMTEPNSGTSHFGSPDPFPWAGTVLRETKIAIQNDVGKQLYEQLTKWRTQF